MRKIVVLSLLAALFVSCGVPKAEFEELKKKSEETEKKLKEKETENADLTAKLDAMNHQASEAKSMSQILLDNMGNLSALSKKGAENLEKALESINEKDKRITSLQDAVNRKDSITFALVSSIKGSLGDINDEDISINVDKGVVYISIADNMLFRSGSYTVSRSAKGILSKVAKIVNDKSDFDFIVEGHTDNVPIRLPGIKDNWDLSVLRATSIVRILGSDYNVDSARMSASGRSEFAPLASNDTAEGRKTNRRIKIILIPKLDQFYGMVEEALQID